MGSSSLIAASTSGVHHSAGNPDPAVTFRPRRFTRPRRLAPPPAFAGLFHPAATSRVCPSGVCPLRRSRTGFPRPIHALLPLSAAACDQRLRPRLQGLAPRRECGVGRNGSGFDRSAPLVGFSSSGCSLRATWECLHIPSAFDLAPRGTPRGRSLAFRRRTDWLAWDQAADPLELSGLNPRPPFESRVRGPLPGDPPEPPDTQTHRARVVPAFEQRNQWERLKNSDRPARTIWTPSCAAAGDLRGKAVTRLWTRSARVSVGRCGLSNSWSIDQPLTKAYSVASDLRRQGSTVNAERRSAGIRNGRPRASST
jgi:hypothetical protein